MPARPQAQRVGRPVDPSRITRALMSARWWILGSLVAGLVVSVPLTKWVAPLSYLARASFLWERAPTRDAASEDARTMRTMIDSVELPSNLAVVRKRLKIPMTLPQLGAAVEVTTEPGSNLVLVTARDPSRWRAARIANTLVEAFLAQRHLYDEGRRKENARMIGADLERAHRDLEATRRRHDAFRAKEHISDLSLDIQRAIEDAANLRAAADLARAEASAEEGRSQALRAESRRLPRVIVHETTTQKTGVSPEQQRLDTARQELGDARTRISAEHPTAQLLQSKVDTLQDAVRNTSPTSTRQEDRLVAPSGQLQAIQGTMAAAQAQRLVALQRSRALGELESEAEERLLHLSAIEGEASSLLAAQRVAEAHVLELEGLQARGLDAARSPSASLRFLARARPPDEPESRLRQRIVMASTPALALLMTVLISVLRSLRGLKVRTPVELAYWGGGPVVGSSSWPHDPESLQDLVEELDDLYPEARGTTLVLPAMPEETEAAQKVAELLSETTVTVTGQAAADDPEPIVGPIAAPASRTALVHLPREASALAVAEKSLSTEHVVEPWRGAPEGPELRRAVRLADRVLVLYRAGSMTPPQVAGLRTRLGREDGVGYLVVGLDPDAEDLPDRAGPVERFWKSRRPK